MKVLISRGYGGFALSDAAYEKLIERGMPVKKYEHSKTSVENINAYEGQVIFDRHLEEPPRSEHEAFDRRAFHEFEDNRYFEFWSQHCRAHSMLVSVFIEIGDAAARADSDLAILEIPDDVKFVIHDDHGREYCAEEVRSWGR